MLTIGIAGFGEVGRTIGRGLAERANQVAVFDPLIDGNTGMRQQCQDWGLTVVPDLPALVEAANVIFVMTPGSRSMSVAEIAAVHMGSQHLYADWSSKSPMQAVANRQIVEQSGAAFVDVAIMAGLPGKGYEVPLVVSGPGAERFATLDIGLSVDRLPGDAGVAAGVKMLRSLLIKGLEGVILEFIEAASRTQGGEYALKSIDGSLPMHSWEDLTVYLVQRNTEHGVRRADELAEVASMLDRLGVGSSVAKASSERLRWLATTGYADRLREEKKLGLDRIFELLSGAHQGDGSGVAGTKTENMKER